MSNPVRRVLLLLSPTTYREGAFQQAAHALGIEVVRGVALPEQLAEYWHVPLQLQFGSIEESVRAVREYHALQPLDAVLAVDDSATLLAAHVNAALGLKGNSPDAALAARDKFVMRSMFWRAGVRTPWFRRVPLASDPSVLSHEVEYPCVVKPLRLSGSRGVMRADNPAELQAAFLRLRRLLLADGNALDESYALIEQFLPGFEVALEGLLTGGSLQVLALFDKPDPLDGPYFEETIYITPSRLPEGVQAEIARCTERGAEALGLREGPVHAELRVDSAGPWIVEMAGRSIGGLCSDILRFGVDMCLEELILRQALGMDPGELRREDAAVGVMMIPIPAAGLLRGVEGVEEAKAVPLVADVQITARPGQTLVPLPEGSSYLGFIFARGEHPAEVEAALRRAHSRLKFKVQPELPVLRPFETECSDQSHRVQESLPEPVSESN